VTLRTKIATSESEQRVAVRFTDLGPIDRVLHAAASPTWIYVLLVLGLAAIAFEATQPGFGFAGFSGVAMLALAVYGLPCRSLRSASRCSCRIGLLTLDVRPERSGRSRSSGCSRSSRDRS
jgi:hypothetical protein